MDMPCAVCEKDTEHYFYSAPGAVTQVTCNECDEVTDIEFEEDF